MDVEIDIVSDVACPWCYIGKRRLEQAETMLPDDITLIKRWRPFLLDATLPKEGLERTEYMTRKFGGHDRMLEIFETMRAAGREVGIDFRFEDMQRSPNTTDAHRLIRWAASEDEEIQDKVVELLFHKFFTEARNVGDDAVLLETAVEAGMDRAIVESLLKGDADRQAVLDEVGVAQKMGVTGVPCYILVGKYAVMGAQPPDMMADAITQAARETG